jgi:hypothetical protein
MPDDDVRVTAWLQALDERHLANLTPPEAARALRALSSCYVERRAKLARGGALDSAGKRAAFALFYGPVHFLVVHEVVAALPGTRQIRHLLDLGCGTGAAGAAWALAAEGCTVRGVDRHPWAVAEAHWAYRVLEVGGRAVLGDVGRIRTKAGKSDAILAAYTVNELPDRARDGLLVQLLAAHGRGARVLIVEPIARGIAGWWSQWEKTISEAGGTANEWRFPATLPDRQRNLARAAGLNPRELTARSLWL